MKLVVFPRFVMSSAMRSIVVVLLALVNSVESDHRASIQMYLGSGCFWGRQHDLTLLEQNTFKRNDTEITSIGGYAGGAAKPVSGHLCYYNSRNESQYSELGDAEVVQIDVPGVSALRPVFQTFFGSFVQIDTHTWAREEICSQPPRR